MNTSIITQGYVPAPPNLLITQGYTGGSMPPPPGPTSTGGVLVTYIPMNR